MMRLMEAQPPQRFYRYDLCSNRSCNMVYRCEYKADTQCHVCSAARYRQAQRTMMYAPISGWVQDLNSSRAGARSSCAR